MKEEERLKSIPYGKADFAEFKKRNLYFVDKTRYIRDIEEKGYFLFFIHPRRFGKSLFLSIMECYYDVLLKDQFDFLFNGTAIHQNPTEEKNSYMVLKLNFSLVKPGVASIETTFHNYIKDSVTDFITKYSSLLDIDIDKAVAELNSRENASELMVTFLKYCKRKKQKLYVIIDEYDNFANTILTSSGKASFHDLTHGEGFFRSFFNVLKGGTSDADAPISRIFITGVSPITLDDVTSGFNIATNISLDSNLNEILGFTSEEVETMIDYYRQTGKIKHSTAELMAIMSQWYNHYRFSIRATREVFNTTLVLYFLQEYMKDSRIPDEMVDNNVQIDYNKLRHLIVIDKEGAKKANGNFSKLLHIVQSGEVHSTIERSFPIEDLTDTNNFVSLLYYFGLLTIGGIDDEDTPILRIPNETIKRLYFDYIHDTYKETGVLNLRTDEYKTLIRGMAYKGNWEELVDFIAGCMESSLSLRDLMTSEKAHQVFWIVYLGLSTLYHIYSEKEIGQGYCDLAMVPTLEQNPKIQYSYIIELKYIKPSDYEKKDGAEKVETLRSEAAEQLSRYSLDEKFINTVSQTRLKKLILIFSGNKLIHNSEI
ncbi:MAG: AAA family ATPase [Candidatus Omnitrophota bacterium]